MAFLIRTFPFMSWERRRFKYYSSPIMSTALNNHVDPDS